MGGGGGGGGYYPPTSPPTIVMPEPAPLPAAPPPPPTMADQGVKDARDAAKRKARGMAGYASTITTSGMGVITPAQTTAPPPKALLGS